MGKTLPYISDDLLLEYVKEVLDAAKVADTNKDIHRNVIDPFSALFDAMRQDIPLDKWLAQEKMRQTQKSLQNALGDFHHKVIGHMPGWEYLVTGGGYDVKCVSKKTIAEIKNKFNTMNSGKSLEVYDTLSRFLDYNPTHRKFTAYVVHIVPRNPNGYDEPFAPSERGTPRKRREDIRVIDGRSFYEKATGDANALHDLYNKLPDILAKITGSHPEKISNSQAFKKLFERAYDPT